MRRPRRSVLSRRPPNPWKASSAPEANEAERAEAPAAWACTSKAPSPSVWTRSVMVCAGSLVESVTSTAPPAPPAWWASITSFAANRCGGVGATGLVSGAPGSTG